MKRILLRTLVIAVLTVNLLAWLVGHYSDVDIGPAFRVALIFGILFIATIFTGAAMMVVELVPAELGARVQQAIDIPVIGIGAGPDTAGQVLVLHDMLGLSSGRLPRFVRNFMDGATSVQDAVRAYVQAVKAGEFPQPQVHTY